MFRKYRGIKLSYAKQGLVFFTCANFKDLDKKEQEYIRRLTKEVAGAEYKTLMRVIRGQVSVRRASMESGINEKRLYIWRKKFYEKYAEKNRAV